MRLDDELPSNVSAIRGPASVTSCRTGGDRAGVGPAATAILGRGVGGGAGTTVGVGSGGRARRRNRRHIEVDRGFGKSDHADAIAVADRVWDLPLDPTFVADGERPEQVFVVQHHDPGAGGARDTDHAPVISVKRFGDHARRPGNGASNGCWRSWIEIRSAMWTPTAVRRRAERAVVTAMIQAGCKGRRAIVNAPLNKSLEEPSRRHFRPQ